MPGRARYKITQAFTNPVSSRYMLAAVPSAVAVEWKFSRMNITLDLLFLNIHNPFTNEKN